MASPSMKTNTTDRRLMGGSAKADPPISFTSSYIDLESLQDETTIRSPPPLVCEKVTKNGQIKHQGFSKV